MVVRDWGRSVQREKTLSVNNAPYSSLHGFDDSEELVEHAEEDKLSVKA
jgi:hypothetical protein